MYNFKNFSPEEFEELCCDILRIVTKTELRIYANGKDNGIDISDVSTGRKIIAQAKRYVKSNFSKLMTAMEKEALRMKKIMPERYYVMTSLELSPSQNDNILNLFSGIMPDKSFIWDAIRIDEFLDSDDGHEIRLKNYKLWLTSINVIEDIFMNDICMDRESFKRKIEKEKTLFYETSNYNQLLKEIAKEKAVLVNGTPGSGKTISCDIATIHFVEKENLKLIYLSNNDITEIKRNVYGRDGLIIYIDDFLGQTKLDNNCENKLNELISLVNYVKSKEKSYILMNSRVYIFEEALQKYTKFETAIQNGMVYLHRMDSISMYDKARLLYNHLFYCLKDTDKFAELTKDKKYFNIIGHKNYNPRIIEKVTKNVDEVHSDKYYDYIMKNLDYPDNVWRHEFENTMDNVDRIVLFTLYSLTDDSIELDVLSQVVSKRLWQENIDTTINVFMNSITRLSHYILKLFKKNNIMYIEVENPSVNDFIKKYINDSEKQKIVYCSMYIDQYIRIYEDYLTNKQLIIKCMDLSIFNLRTINYVIELEFLNIITTNAIKRIELKDKILSVVFKSYDYPLLFLRYSMMKMLKIFFEKKCTYIMIF